MFKRFILKNNVFINPSAKDKEELITRLSKKAYDMGFITSIDKMIENIENKEQIAITELKPHIVLPHARGNFIKKLFVFIAVSKGGIPYKGAKKNIADVVIFIGIPEGDHDYLKLLASISRYMSKDEFIEDLKKSEVEDDVVFAIKKFAGSDEAEKSGAKKYFIILSLNTRPESSNIATLFAEIGVDLATEIEGKNLGHASVFVPFINAFGFSGVVSKYNRTYFGLTDDKEAASKLYSLLKSEGINLSEHGTGSLLQIEAMEAYGGFAEDVDF
jgi:mannitol/fructose-specific phosphotransferase system IIA component (Ntr-type)